MGFLDFGPILATRRNHGIEHATIHVLAERFPQLHLAGRADRGGFYILGDIPTEAIAPAVEEAMRRVRGGEHDLVVHPRCGTNLVVAGLLAGLSSFAVAGGRRDESPIEKLPRMVLATTTALLLAQPLGPKVQEKWTTSWNFDGAWLRDIKKRIAGSMLIHRVEIGEGPQ
jgi:hypothetical protein